MNDLFFYNCLHLKVISDSFGKGLILAIPKHKAQYQDNRYDHTYILQLYDWHKVKVIKYYLVVVGRYPKKVCKKIIDLIWK